MDDDLRRELHKEAVGLMLDEGTVIETGFRALRLLMPPDAPESMVRQMRKAFFAGAMHVWSSMLAVLDQESQYTENDLRRMIGIQSELNKFSVELEVEAKAFLAKYEQRDGV